MSREVFLILKNRKEDIEKVTEAAAKMDKIVTSSFSNVDLSLDGQIDRVFLIIARLSDQSVILIHLVV